MSMKYDGWMFYELGGVEHEVNFVKIATNQVRIGWMEDGDNGTLDVTSTDGVTYDGVYSYNTGYPGRTTLRLYRAGDGGVILIGQWSDAEDKGRWMFHLKPLPSSRKGSGK